MILLLVVTLGFFSFFQIQPIIVGPVGLAFQTSMSMVCAIGVLATWHEHYKKRTSITNRSGSWVQGQLNVFWTIPTSLKVGILFLAIVLPVIVDKVVK